MDRVAEAENPTPKPVFDASAYDNPSNLIPGDPRQGDPTIQLDAKFGEVDASRLFAKEYVNAHANARLRQLVHELAKRKVEALHLYEPLEEQQKFHACCAAYRLAIGSNRSGKTLCAAVEVARAVTGQDPHGKYPKREGTAFIVGKDQKHVGKVLYEKLFRSNSGFKIIRDPVTKKWRAFKPWLAEDVNRKHEARFAPPLIPKRFIHEIAWENKKENVPSVIRLINGWELHFFSSLGKPPQGSPIDLFWFDEEIVDPQWYPEMAARIVDRMGRGIWSATPQAGTEQLYELHERAEKERATLEEKNRRIVEYTLLLADNKHQDEEAKRQFAMDMSEEEQRVRVHGQYAILSAKVYPTFSEILHSWPNQEIPADWTRYAYIDPGHRTCAVLFVAVPPKDFKPESIVIYEELYLREVDADKFGAAMKAATALQSIEAFIIDMHMALHSDIGVGKSVMQQYSESLVKHGVRSVSTGSGFIFANDDVMAGVLAVQGLLRPRADGNPKLRVIVERCPNFCWEIKRYHRKRVAGVVQEAPNNTKDNHLMDDLRYMALHDPKWVKPREGKRKGGGSLAHYQEKMRRRASRDGDDAHIKMGPGGKFY